MRFRTEIEITPWQERIDHRSRIFAVGSCFASSVSERLKRAKFNVTSNPIGILFNPNSIYKSLLYINNIKQFNINELQQFNESFGLYDFSSDFCASSRSEALAKINSAISRAHDALEHADWVIITLGTAWVYRLRSTGEVVANCHKQPQQLFERKCLTVDEIVEQFTTLFSTVLRDKRVILTVSPVRHTGDGLVENSTSKAILKVATSILSNSLDNIYYFPAYEIVNDDLRDYRFYAEDLVHPSHQAVDYIWEKLVQTALSEHAQKLLPQIERIVVAAEHRPFNPTSEEYKSFCRKQIELLDATPEIDFSKERAIFEAFYK